MKIETFAKIRDIYDSVPLIPKIASGFLLTLCIGYASATTAIMSINPKIFQQYDQAAFFALFERNLSTYAHSDKAESDPVIVGPSYAARLCNPYGAYNLGIVAGYRGETAFVIEHYCRKEDSIIYVLNVYECDTIKGSSENVRPEIRSRFKMRATLFRYLVKGYSKNLFQKNKSDQIHNQGSMRRLNDIYEELSFVMDNPDAPEEWLRRLNQSINWLNKHDSDLSEDADYYKQLKRKHPNIRYVYLPCLPLKNHPTNDQLNNKIGKIRKREQHFLAELEKKKITYVDLGKVLEKEDYKDLFHLNTKGLEKVSDYLHALGYI